MKRFFLCLLLFWVIPLPAVEKFPRQKELLMGLDHYNHDRVTQALAIFDKIIQEDPASPIGHFFKAAIACQIMIDYETEVYADFFNESIEKTLSLSEAWAKEKDHEDLGTFFWAGALGYRGVRKSEAGDWWGAFKDGGRAYDLFRKALEMDPECYDAYYGTGLYRYWKTAKGKKVWFFGAFIHDEREEGIADLWKIIEKGIITATEARAALHKIYFREKNYAKVIELTEEFLKLYPEKMNSLWYNAHAHLALGEWAKAEETFEKGLDRLKLQEFPTLRSQGHLRYYQALVQAKQGRTEDAAATLTQLRKDIELETGDSTDRLRKKAQKLLKALPSGPPTDEFIQKELEEIAEN